MRPWTYFVGWWSLFLFCLQVDSVTLALQILDGWQIRGHTLHVQRAKFQMKGDYNPQLKPKKKKNQKEKQKKIQEKYDYFVLILSMSKFEVTNCCQKLFWIKIDKSPQISLICCKNNLSIFIATFHQLWKIDFLWTL